MHEDIKGTLSLPLGVYQHYKRGLLYRVHAVGRIHDTLEPVVIYESLENSEDFPAGTYFVRPFLEFTSSIQKESGEEVERFAYKNEYDNWIL